MDNLDALLNELHQANLEFLKRTNVSSGPSQQHNVPSVKKCTETEIDAVPPNVLSTPTHSHSSKLPSWKSAETSQPSVNKYIGNQTAMPYALDADLQLGQFSVERQFSRGNSDSTRSTGLTKEEDEDARRQTVLAAEKAARQLDDLLASLSQIKFDSQQERSAGQARGASQTNGVTAKPARTGNTGGTPAGMSDSHGRALAADERAAAARQSGQARSGEHLQPQSPAAQQPPAPTQQSLVNSLLTDLSNEVGQLGASTSARGVCFACNKPIISRLVSALDKSWHPEHFTCANCGTGLARADYYEQDNQAYCASCHPKLFSPKCAYCGEAILEKCIVALSRAWHPEHFFCHHCHTSFGGNLTVNEHDNNIYCSVCYLNMFATRCSGCQQPITDTYITALDVPWHRQCFVCRDCGKVLTGSNFHELDGSAYCQLHYHAKRGLLCAACSQPITGRCVNAMGQRFHPEHFVCAYCLQPPPTGTYKEHGGRPYCHKCFAQLFE